MTITTTRPVVHIDRARAVELLEEVVAEHGADTTVEDNQYFTIDRDPEGVVIQETPCCIVGHVFAKLGVTSADLHHAARDANKTSLTHISVEGVQFDRDAELLLEDAQARQDIGQSWGFAVCRAKATA